MDDDERKNQHPEVLKDFDQMGELAKINKIIFADKPLKEKSKEEELGDVIERVIRSKWFVLAVYIGLFLLTVVVFKASWHCIINSPCEACEETTGRICHYISIPFGVDSKDYLDKMKDNLYHMNLSELRNNQTNST